MVVGALIFDLGGVLIAEGEPVVRRSREAELGLAVGELDRIVTDAVGPGWVGGRTEAEIRQRQADATGLGLGQIEALLDDFHAHAYVDPVLSGYIGCVRPRLRVATLSNAGPDQRQVSIDKFGLDRLVDLMVISAEERIQKPDPAIYRLAADRLGVAPEGCVFVDDRPDNVEGAKAVGMTAFVHHNSQATVAQLEKLVDGRTEDLG